VSKPELKPWHGTSPAAEASHPFTRLLLDELWEAAAPEQAAAFFRATGARLAREHSLETLESDHEILGSINALWAEWGWGQVFFDLTETGLRILHVDLPPVQAGDEARWREVVLAVLAGAYGQWLSLLGGTPTTQLRLIKADQNEAEFHYGV
jgi:hypothetical protein